MRTGRTRPAVARGKRIAVVRKVGTVILKNMSAGVVERIFLVLGVNDRFPPQEAFA